MNRKNTNSGQAKNQMDRWLTRGGGSVGILLVGLMYHAVGEIRGELAKANEAIIRVTTELDVVSPLDLRRDLQNVSARMLTREDVQRIALDASPSQLERAEIEQRLLKLESQIELLRQR